MPSVLADDLDAVISATESLWNEVRGARIFVTGGTGWFGCWFLESFAWANRHLALKAEMTVLSRDPSALQEKAPHLASDSAVRFHVGDVRSFQFPSGGFSHVIHAATAADTRLNDERPELMLETIVSGTARTIQFAKQAGARKFLLTSSGAVYGKQPADMTHIPETYSGAPDPLDPKSAYATGKRNSELQCVIAARYGSIEAKIARCFAFVGPYMRFDAHFAIGNFIGDQLRGRPIVIKGDGSTVRSYLYMSDLMIWLWTILFRGANCKAYNVGSEEAYTTKNLAQAVAGSLEPHVAVKIEGKPSGAPVDRYVPSTARARAELGLKQAVSLEEAIRKTASWGSRNRSSALA